MISLEEAKQIVNKNKDKNKSIYGMAQTDELFIFTVMTEEDFKSKNLDIVYDDYVTTVDKKTGKFGSLNFNEYAKLVESNKVRNI